MDDCSAVLNNADVERSNWSDVVVHDFWGTHIRSVHSHKSYRPLTVLSFRLNCALARGHSAWLYYSTNALMHAGCAALVWKVADVLFQQHHHRLESANATENLQDSSPTAATGRKEIAVEKKENLVGSVTVALDGDLRERTSDPPPLRSSKRAPTKAVSGTALTEARKGKKKVVRRTNSGRAAFKKSARDVVMDSDANEEAAPPASKKTKKARPSTRLPSTNETKCVEAPHQQGFDLTSFMASFEPDRASVQSAPVPSDHTTDAASPPSNSVPLQVNSAVTIADNMSSSIVTAPNTKGALPPSEVCYLTSASFPEGAKNAKGDYNPPQAYLLAASRMFRAFGTQTGKHLSAMSFVLWMRELERVKFRATPAVLVEAAEMDSLEDGSSNVNFTSDFSTTARLPVAKISCASYDDILDAIHGLSSLGHEVWYDRMRKLTTRLRAFVSKNKSADLDNNPARVRLTLLYTNKFLDSALVLMQSDEPLWWSGYCESLRSVEYQSPSWTMALLSALNQAAPEPLENRKGVSGGQRTKDSHAKVVVRLPFQIGFDS
ncbi:hypothetical protein PHMEG_00015939 [Phytophthora megakarya]|uniref:Uncharacterized protein n=1 Tax=Phytophthora megakarya TaxID=4795 RepID=A0A225W072_9STRA|nr:hypothetical protein PHMEG_00015939 [Phytophthora megakarya]